MTIEALAIKAVPAAFKALVKALSDLGNRNTESLLQAMENDRREHWTRAAQLLPVLMVTWQEQAKSLDELTAKVEAMAADDQFHRLHANLEYEAVRSTLDDRKEMLAAAAAGLCEPNMSINEKARVERVLRELDPEDVVLLDKLRRFHEEMPSANRDGIPIPRHTFAIPSRDLLNKQPMSRGVLLTTACVDAEPITSGPMYVVSQLGELVLRVLRTYLKSGDA